MEEENSKEIRSIGGLGRPTLSLHESGRTISGYAAVFGVPSVRLRDRATRREIIERIMPGAITEELIKRSDVKALYNHDKSKLLARSVNGEGTLSLSIDEKGLKYSFEAPNTQPGEEVAELVRRGDLQGSSFCFTVSRGGYTEKYSAEDGAIIREVNRIDGLFDISIVCDPAYQSTSVSIRSEEDAEVPQETEKKRFGKGDELMSKAVEILIQ